MKFRKNLYFVFVILVLMNFLYAETDSKSRITVNPLPQGVSIHQLDNGLQVLLIENNGLPMTGVNVVVKTGSTYETFSTSGMSHMLEHLLFNGTMTRTQKELYDDVDLMGGYNNANTGHYYTNYMMVTPTDNFVKGMEIQADMLFNSILPEDKFEKEKGIVLEEIARSLENSNEQMDRNINSILYKGHALSLPTLGTYATIESMERDAVYSYYKNTYVPNNMIMSVVGNFNTDSMLVWIKKIYGQAEPKLVQYPENQLWKTGFEKVDDIEKIMGKSYNRFYHGDKQILQMFYMLPADWQDAHFVMIDEALSKSRSEITGSLKDKYSGIEESLTTQNIRTPIANFLQISVAVEDQNDLSNLSIKLIQLFKEINFGLPAETIDYLATSSKTSFLKNIEKPHMFGIYNAHIFAEKGIEEVLLSYTKKSYIQAAIKTRNFTLSGNPAIILQSPFKSEEKHQNEITDKPELSVDKSSGLSMIAEQNASSDLLAIHFLLRYKAQYNAKFGKNAVKILHDCLGQRLNSTENQKISNQFGLTYKVNDNPFIPMDNIYLDPDFSYIRVEGLADDTPGVVDYLKNQINSFVPTEEEFQKALAKTKQPMMGMRSSQSSKMFEKTYRSLIYEEDKYAVNSEPLTYDEISKLANVYFQPSNMIISVVSPEKPQQIFDLFHWEMAKTAKEYNIIKEPYVRQLKTVLAPVSEESKGKGERSFLFWGFVKTIDDTDKPALRALGLLLSDYIIFDVREKQGRAYRMKAGINLIGDHALFFINLGTRPANIDPILEQSPGFFSQQTVGTFTDFDLEKSLNMYLGRMMFRRLSSINKAYYLGHSEYFHQNIMYDTEFLAKLKNVTLSDIQKVAEKYMMITNPVTVIVR